ncbi:hypothetical protein O6H91_18G063900 [Diphasiastrum complanatum]|uniref:Uncharacterized protein n=1 Tax=Diphasiastrum complanatum TaxID=34168 RepID=A0ACC2B244_DIPCM|nr:hypothetical protein O6H91_18G063900 [Diphasiastrum complanatum]
MIFVGLVPCMQQLRPLTFLSPLDSRTVAECFTVRVSNMAFKLVYVSFLFYFLGSVDLSQASARELLLPVIQQLLKDPDVLDPAHKEALEIILRERAGGRLDSISKVMGSHLGMSSVSNLFGENVFPSSRKDAGEQVEPSGLQPLQPEEGMLKRMMRTNFRLGT